MLVGTFIHFAAWILSLGCGVVAQQRPPIRTGTSASLGLAY